MDSYAAVVLEVMKTKRATTERNITEDNGLPPKVVEMNL